MNLNNVVWSRQLETPIHSLCSVAPARLMYLDGNEELGIVDCSTDPVAVCPSGMRVAESLAPVFEGKAVPGSAMLLPYDVRSVTIDNLRRLYAVSPDQLSLDLLSEKGLFLRNLVKMNNSTWRLDKVAWSKPQAALIVACHDEECQTSDNQVKIVKIEYC